MGKVVRVEGVKKVVPVLFSRWNTSRMVLVGIPRMVVGISPHELPAVGGNFKLLKGKPDINTPSSALVGYDIYRSLPNSTEIEIENNRFSVVGVYEKTGGLIDGQIFIPLAQAQKIFHRQGLITSIFVIPDKKTDPDILSKKISSSVEGVEVIPPHQLQEQIRSSLSLWNLLAGGSALIAGLAGSLCVIITMLFSISERVVEIGIKKAIGAETHHIMIEFLTESVIITVMGFIIGTAGGYLFILLTWPILISQGSAFFNPTLRLFLWAFIGSLLLGIISGLYPAYKASVLSPIEALKVRY